MKTQTEGLRLVVDIFNRPFLIEETSLQTMIGAVSNHMGLLKEGAAFSSRARNGIDSRGAVAVIPVSGVLSQKSNGLLSILFGDTSYEEIRASFGEALANQAVGSILFDVDSPGGEVNGLFDLVDEIYQARGRKPVFSVIHEIGFSAAYAIASAADMVFIPRTGRTGSIGVINVHIDQSEADAQEGLKYTAIYAGARKNDFSPHEPLSEEARTVAQKQVDEIYTLFVETVARNRGVKAEDVRAQEARMYLGQKAVEAGLADSVLSWDESLNEIKKISGKGDWQMKVLQEQLTALFKDAPQEKVAGALEALGYVPKPTGEPVDVEKIKTEATAAGAAAARTETLAYVQTIHEMCALAGMEKMAPGLIQRQAKPDEARQEVLTAKAAEAEKTKIRSTVSAISTGEVNPLVADAKKRAGTDTKK